MAAQEITLGMERDLRAFLCGSLEQLEPGLTVYQQGEEFVTDVGRLDLLVVDREGNFLVIELKAGKAGDSALGQLLGYMGYVSDKVAKSRHARGCMVASDFDERLKYAVSSLRDVSLKRYRVTFSFEDVG